MEIKAKARYIHTSPKKIRLVLDLVRGMDVEAALRQLQFTNKKACGPISKLLNSAIANATNNFNLDKSNLFIKEIRGDDGPTLKRWRPRAFGRATPIRKRTTHISIILAEKKPSKQVNKEKAKVEAPVAIKDFEKSLDSKPETDSSKKTRVSGETEKKTEVEKPKKSRKEQTQLEQLRKSKKKGILRGVFNRKTG